MDNKKGHVSFPASHVIFEGVRIKLRFDYSEWLPGVNLPTSSTIKTWLLGP